MRYLDGTSWTNNINDINDNIYYLWCANSMGIWSNAQRYFLALHGSTLGREKQNWRKPSWWGGRKESDLDGTCWIKRGPMVWQRKSHSILRTRSKPLNQVRSTTKSTEMWCPVQESNPRGERGVYYQYATHDWTLFPKIHVSLAANENLRRSIVQTSRQKQTDQACLLPPCCREL